MLRQFGRVKLSYFRPFKTFCTFPYVGSLNVADSRFTAGLLRAGGITIIPNATFNTYKRKFLHVSCTCSLSSLQVTLSHITRFMARVQRVGGWG